MNKSFANFNIKTTLWPYVLFLGWGLIILLCQLFTTTPFTLLIGFFFLWLIPGFALARIFKIDFNRDRFDRFMIYITTGFIFNLLVCLIAVLVQTNLLGLEIGYFTLQIIVFITAFILDCRRTVPTNQDKIDFKSIFSAENLILLIPLGLIILILMAVNVAGADFAGDPTYHLAIMRKVVEGRSLGMNTLSFIKNQPHPAYAYLIWPTFMGLMSKIFHLNIFSFWNEICVSLTILITLAWAWVFRKIFNHRATNVLAIIIFLVFTFSTLGYLFIRTPVPDTVAKFFLLPLSITLALEYLFSQKFDWKMLSLNALVLVLTSCIHMTQYVYFFIIMGVFGVVYTLINITDKKVWEFVKRLLLLVGLNLILVAPLLILLQLTSHTLSQNLAFYASSELVLMYDRFSKLELPVKISFALLPVILLFVRKKPKMLFLFVIMLIAPISYHFTAIRDFMSHTLSFVFMRRLFSNLVWYFAVWAAFVGFIVCLLDRGANLIPEKLKTIFNAIISVLAILIFYLEIKFHLLTNNYQAIFSTTTGDWLVKNINWLSVISLIIVSLIILGQKFWPKLDQFFEFNPIKNYWFAFLLVLIFTLWISTDARSLLMTSAKAEVKKAQFFLPVADATKKTAQLKDVGGQRVLDFIRTQIPARSILESNTGYRDLPELVDDYMAAWPDRNLPDKELSKIYEPDVAMNNKLICLGWYKVDYLMLQISPDKVSQMGFDQVPQYLTSVYPNSPLGPQDDTKIRIFKVNQTNILKDFKIDFTKQPDCRARKYD